MAGRTRLLLTGASGFLGHYLLEAARAAGLEVVRAGRGSEDDVLLELARTSSIAGAVATVRPDVVLHAAAMASMAACEAEPALAHAVNVLATRELARAAPTLFVSTDLVFDGRAAPYASDRAPSPISVYGRTKAEAEREVLAAGGRVARVPLLFGRSHDGRHGATDMIRSATGPLRLFANELRTPLHAADAAAGLVELLCRPFEPPEPSLVHLAGPERLSRYDFGRRFVAIAGLADAVIEETTSTDPTRPRDVSLTSDVAWRRALDEALAES